MQKLLPFLFVFISFKVFAHPSIGIVKDSKGNIYYSDLEQVWKIDGKTNKKSMYVPNVHTHQLYFDSLDNLYGEHLWYEGDATKKFNHYLWRVSAIGKTDTLFRLGQAYIKNDYSLARDRLGNEYFFNVLTQDKIFKKSIKSELKVLSKGDFKDVPWLQVGNDNFIYFVQHNNLYRFDTTGNITTVFKTIANTKATFAFTSSPTVLGIWQDAANNIYAAAFSDQIVKKISPNGKIENIVKSEGDWSPTSGVFDDGGNMWVMEASTQNEVRVRKIEPGKLAVIQASQIEAKRLYWIVGVLIIIGVMTYFYTNRNLQTLVLELLSCAK